MKRIWTSVLCFLVVVVFVNRALISNAAHLYGPAEDRGENPPPLATQSKKITILAENLEGTTAKDEEEFGTGEPGEEIEPVESIADPFERYNRSIFWFNDKIYFHVLKPVAKGYGVIVPEKARVSIDKFFLNLYAPVRFINAGLQGDGKGAVHEVSRFAINSTLGIAGFFDPAKSWFNLEMQHEDFGQTLGRRWGPGLYLDNPFLGPSSLRDSIGELVDLCIVPSLYVLINYPFYYTLGPKLVEIINRTSLTLGEYEDMKRAALDPYTAVKNAHFQYRNELIKKK